MQRTAAGSVLTGVLVFACAAGEEPGSAVEVTRIATTREAEVRVCLDIGGSHFLEVTTEPGAAALALLSTDEGQGDIVSEAEVRLLDGMPRTVRSESADLEAGEPCYRLSVIADVGGETATARLVRE